MSPVTVATSAMNQEASLDEVERIIPQPGDYA